MTTTFRFTAVAAIIFTSLVATGCGRDCCPDGTKPNVMTSTAAAPSQAVAVIQATAGNKVSGTVRFTQNGGKVEIVADVKGLSPNAKHAIHVHEFGDCSAADGMSAGGHFNPEGHVHAGPASSERHAGDLGNLQSDAAGNAKYQLSVDNISIAGKNAIIGRSIVIHEKEDDLKTQPAGNAGPRIGCGVIGVASAK
jgi:superoxide dismutase, Cu-Zn family